MRGLTAIAVAALLLGCNEDPTAEMTQTVGYRSGVGDTTSGERGNVKISEVLWSGSVTDDGVRDQSDIFIELKNEGSLPVNITDWIIEQTGTFTVTWRIPEGDNTVLGVGDRLVIAAKNTGCFPEADILMPELRLPDGAPFKLTLRDSDERLIEPIGHSFHRRRLETMYLHNAEAPQLLKGETCQW